MITPRFAVWFYRGLDARNKCVDMPVVNFKGCPHREADWKEGWLWGDILFKQAKEPPEPDFLDGVIAIHCQRAKEVAGGV